MEIINSFGLNCDKEKIIQTLCDEVQPDDIPVYISSFNKVKSIDVEVWDNEEKICQKIGILVQPADSCGERVTRKWNKPKIQSKFMDTYKTRIIAVKREEPFYHAMFVKSFEEKSDQFHFECIDSRVEPGTSETNHVFLPQTDVSELFYISIYSDSYIETSHRLIILK